MRGTKAAGILHTGAPGALRCVSVILAIAVGAASTAQAQATECDARQILAPGTCVGDDVDSLEFRLADLINDYRKQHGLSVIAISPALSAVANRHARDLAMNLGKLSHDWSNCAMTDPTCMWSAPKKLGTGYMAAGYESVYAGETQDPARILTTWREKGNGPHNDVLLNLRSWSRFEWRALGIGIYKGYAVMWVGAEADTGQGGRGSGAMIPKP